MRPAPNPFDFHIHLKLLYIWRSSIATRINQFTLCFRKATFIFDSLNFFSPRYHQLFQIIALHQWEEHLVVTKPDSRKVHGPQRKIISSSTIFSSMEQEIGETFQRMLVCKTFFITFLILGSFYFLLFIRWLFFRSNALHICIGLQRCGKSCRLRWTNYLRPDIKRGRFSFEEEESIIQLHSILGNKYDYYSPLSFI